MGGDEEVRLLMVGDAKGFDGRRCKGWWLRFLRRLALRSMKEFVPRRRRARVCGKDDVGEVKGCEEGLCDLHGSRKCLSREFIGSFIYRH
ncbi:hypothetical protein U1Q18_044013 [Sarracenia purpurea var. burkii]